MLWRICKKEYSLTLKVRKHKADPEIDQQVAQTEVSRLKQAIEKLGPVN